MSKKEQQKQREERPTEMMKFLLPVLGIVGIHIAMKNMNIQEANTITTFLALASSYWYTRNSKV